MHCQSSEHVFSLTVLNVRICHWHMSHVLSHTRQIPSLSSCPHLPPIWPLEETRWVRGWVAHGSLGIGEVLVVTAESRRRFGQPEGAHRPGWGRPNPERGDFSRTPLRLSHLGFQMKEWRGCSRGRNPLTVCSLVCCCLFSTTVFSEHKETIEHWQYLWLCSHNDECHAQTGT